MTHYSHKESLQNALEYLEVLYDELISEIEAKTVEIRIHREKRSHFFHKTLQIEDNKSFLRKWRRESFALHQRRAKLKDVKDCLDRQIKDVKTSLGRRDHIAHISPSPTMERYTAMPSATTYA